MLDFLSIGVFIDGGYYAKINRALKARDRSIIKVSALFEYICSEISMQEGINISDCQITEAHYFRGRFRVKEAYDKHLLYNERKFEDSISSAFHLSRNTVRKYVRLFQESGIPMA